MFEFEDMLWDYDYKNDGDETHEEDVEQEEGDEDEDEDEAGDEGRRLVLYAAGHFDTGHICGLM